MTSLEQKIWEACGSPYTTWGENCSMTVGGQCSCHKGGMKLIEITLAHVMQLLSRFAELHLNDESVRFKVYKMLHNHPIFDGVFTFIGEFDWCYKMSTGEAANFADQSDETKEAICKVVGLI